MSNTVKRFAVDVRIKGEGYSARSFVVMATDEEQAQELARAEYIKLIETQILKFK